MTQVSGSRRGDYHQAIERLFHEGSVSGLSEAQLLERFALRQDEAAFEALVERHGPMVLGVCRRFLRDPNDVDDAFQAVFLVLVRRAGDIRRKELLGNWLYGVACRVAVRARSLAARRPAGTISETDGDQIAVDLRRSTSQEPDEDPSWLHEEVERLPRRYRQPVVACYFEGRTHEEAATLLGCPLGTVKGRLSRARDLLRKRLERRGLAVPAVALAARLASPDLRAAVPVPLVQTTVRSGLGLVAAGASLMTTSAISTSVRTLSEGVLHAMLVTHIKAVAIPVVLAAGVFTTGAVGVARLHAGDQTETTAETPARQQAAQAKASSEDEDAPAESADSAEPDGAFSETFQFLAGVEEKHRAAQKQLQDDLQRSETEDDRERARSEHQKRIEALIDEIENEGHEDEAAQALKSTFLTHLKKAEEIKGEEEPKPEAEFKSAAEAQPPAQGGVVVGGFGGVMRGVGSVGMAGGDGGGATDEPSNEQYRVWIARGSAVLSRVDASPMNQAVLKALENPVTLRSNDKTTLGRMLKQIKETVKTADGKKIPIYIDPQALEEAEKTIESPVVIDLEDVPLKFSLRLMLKQLGLAYCVRDGVLIISSLEGVQQELMEAQSEQMGLNPDKFPMGGMGGGMGGMGGGMGGMGGGQGMM